MGIIHFFYFGTIISEAIKKTPLKKIHFSLLFLFILFSHLQITAQSSGKLKGVKLADPERLGVKVEKYNGKPLEDAPYSAPVSTSTTTKDSLTTPTLLDSSNTFKIPEKVKIGILLPFEADYSLSKIYSLTNATEQTKSGSVKLREVNRESIDFYEGLLYALSTNSPSYQVELFTYDTHNNDSILEIILKNDTLKNCQLILGPATVSQAKLVASFCKKNKIINIQPFVSSKTITSENPYLVRFVPTIDAHLDKIFTTIVDSFSDANVIVYSTKRERDLSAAKYIDTLFYNYNQTHTKKIKNYFINTGDTTKSAAQKNIATYTSTRTRNVLVFTSYDESYINQMLRGISKGEMIVFGMPTWVDAELIRTDYLNNSEVHFTEPFYADSLDNQNRNFCKWYNVANNHLPSKESYLGYDITNYVTLLITNFGLNFTTGMLTRPYQGLGYKFDMTRIVKNKKNGGEDSTNYYSNKGLHLFKIQDYKVVNLN